MVNGEMTFSDNKKVYRDSDDDDFDETPLLVLLP